MVDARQTFGLAVCLSVRIMQLSGAVMIVRVFVTMHIMRMSRMVPIICVSGLMRLCMRVFTTAHEVIRMSMII